MGRSLMTVTAFQHLGDPNGTLATDLLPQGQTATGERRLIAEVVLSALTDLGVIASRGPRSVTHIRSAEAWLNSRDITWPFAFENCCAVLGLSAERIRSLAAALRDLPRPHRLAHCEGTAKGLRWA